MRQCGNGGRRALRSGAPAVTPGASAQAGNAQCPLPNASRSVCHILLNSVSHIVPRHLNLVTILKHILRQQEKRSTVEIQMKKPGRLQHMTKLPPCPDLMTDRCLNTHMVLI